MLNDSETYSPSCAFVGKVFYWRARCDKCSWTGGDMLFRSEAEQEAKAHNAYAHESREEEAKHDSKG